MRTRYGRPSRHDPRWRGSGARRWTCGRPDGQALVIVLWAMGLVSLGVGAVSVRASHDLRLGRIRYGQLEAAAITQAAVQQAVAVVAEDDSEVDHLSEPWATGVDLDEQPLFEAIALGRGTFSIGVVDAEDVFQPGLIDTQRRVNLNTATPETLIRLMELVQIENPELPGINPVDVAGAIEDWRDEPDGIWCEGLSYPCANAPFEAKEELLLVPGLPPAWLEALEPSVTVVGDGRVNLNTADPLVLEVVGLTSQQIDAVIELRQEEPFTTIPPGYPDGLGVASCCFEALVSVQADSVPTPVERLAVINRGGVVLRWVAR